MLEYGEGSAQVFVPTWVCGESGYIGKIADWELYNHTVKFKLHRTVINT